MGEDGPVSDRRAPKPQPFDLPVPEASNTDAIPARLESGHAADTRFKIDAAYATGEVLDIGAEEGHQDERNEDDSLSNQFTRSDGR